MWRRLLGELSRRPVAIFLLMGTLIFLGLFSWQKLPVDLLPNLNVPYALIVTPYIGATPEEVERDITDPLESAVSFASGVKSVSSQSRDGYSILTVEFEGDTNMAFAISRLRDSIDTFSFELASDVDPIIVEFNPSLLPVYILGISSREANDLQTQTNKLMGALSRIDGVANVMLAGIPEQQVVVTLDRERMEELEIPLEIVKTVLEEGVRYPMGFLEKDGLVYTLSVRCEFTSLEELSSTVVGFRGMGSSISALTLETGQAFQLDGIPIPVRLNQIATVELVDQEIRGAISVNGRSAAVLTVQKQSGANTVNVAAEISKLLKEWEKSEIQSEVITISDTSQFTNMAINGLFKNLLIGALVATLVIFAFLRNFVATLAIAVSMPLSLLTAILILYFSGFGLDLMTLGGLTMAVGMIVDNSIVVLEAIYRYLEARKKPYEAAGEGSEIVGAIFSSTLTTVAVFVPFAFISGLAAQIFRYFAFALAFSLGASLFIAIVMIPAFTGFIRVKQPRESNYLRYKAFLKKLLERRLLTVLVFVAIFVLSLFGFFFRSTEFIPGFDNGIVTIDFTLPKNTDYRTTVKVAKEIEDAIMENSEELALKTVYTMAGVTGDIIALLTGSSENMATVQVYLKDLGERRISTDDALRSLSKIANGIVEKYDGEISIGTSGLELEAVFGRDIEIAVFDSDLDSMKARVETLAAELAGVGGIENIQTSFDNRQDVLELTIDRSKATLAGLYHLQVLGAIQPYTVGIDLGKISLNGKSLPVKLQQAKGEGYEWIKSLPIDSLLGNKTYVGIVSSMEIKESPSTIEHLDNQRVGYVKADVLGRPLGHVVEEVREIIDGRDGLADCQLKGQGDLIQQVIEQFGFALLAGIVFMYLIIGAQFESLVYPLVIFCTLPMALVGVVVVSYLFNLTINISSLVGVLTLAGVIVNNGIVMITQINQLRKGGMEKREAILEGAGRRARPILMTSLTTVVALLPTAFIKAEGSELESPLALVIAGGLLVGTLFTLLLTPVLYDLIDNLSVRFKKKNPIQ